MINIISLVILSSEKYKRFVLESIYMTFQNAQSHILITLDSDPIYQGTKFKYIALKVDSKFQC